VSEPIVRPDRERILLESGMTLASELSLDAVLRRIVELAVGATHARYGALGVLSPDGRRIEEFITVGVTDEERAAIGDPPTGHGILGVLISDPHPLRLSNIADDPRSVGFPANHPSMRSLLGAPVMARGRVFGNIYLTQKQGADVFSDEDQRAIEVLAIQAGVAVENARLHEATERADRELRRLEVFEERERIAKELHDGVIQSLFAVGMSLQGLSAMLQSDEAERRLNIAVEDIDHAIRDLRNYIFGLRPGILADRHLDQAIRELVSDFGSRTGVVAAADIDPRVASELASRAGDIVQLVREGLSNIGRHGAATTCRVSLRREGTGILVEIDDDGSGFDVDQVAWGMGLTNLKARVHAMGGDFEIQSVVGEGTTVRALLPP
jgi:signal transduction histidine kinase